MAGPAAAAGPAVEVEEAEEDEVEVEEADDDENVDNLELSP